MDGKSEFIIKAERRAQRRQSRIEREANAHVHPWHEKRGLEERATVAASVARQRWLTGATGEPEPMRPAEPSAIFEERVDRPLLTWAEFLHELEQGKPHAGKEIVSMNFRTVLGGFCRFHGTEAQQKACARLKSLYERSQVGGAKAVDPSLEPVDGGGINPEANIEIGADARKAYTAARDLLGKQDMERIEFVVIRERGPTPYAKWRGFPDGGRGVSRGMVEVRAIADRLAVHWQLQHG